MGCYFLFGLGRGAGLRRRQLVLPRQRAKISSGITSRFGLAAVGIDPDHVLAAIGQPKLVKTRLGELIGLRGSGFLQRKRPLAVRVDHFHAYRLLLGGAQFEIGVDQPRTAAAFRAGKIARGLLDERDENRIDGKIVGEVVEPEAKSSTRPSPIFLSSSTRV